MKPPREKIKPRDHNFTLVTTEDFIAFILAQPDDQPIRQNEAWREEVGFCVIRKYGIEVLKIEGRFATSFSTWWVSGEVVAEFAEPEKMADFLKVLNCFYTYDTYEEVKTLVKFWFRKQ